MAKAKFTQAQIDQATAEFFGENSEWTNVILPGAGNNGTIKIYTKEIQNGNDQAQSQ
jgi:hypothetical protein